MKYTYKETDENYYVIRNYILFFCFQNSFLENDICKYNVKKDVFIFL